MENLPAKPEDSVSAFLSAHGGPAGEFLKFGKAGTFVRVSDEEEVPEGTKLICVYDQAQHGWIKFNGKGEPPDRRMGPIFGGYVPPPRTELGDDDVSQWEIGLSGKPQDPWRQQVLLPLMDPETNGMYIFGTSSVTGLRAVASLIAICNQMRARQPDVYPVIELQVGAFEHRDPRVGTVKKPGFKVVGKAPRSGAAAHEIGSERRSPGANARRSSQQTRGSKLWMD